MWGQSAFDKELARNPTTRLTLGGDPTTRLTLGGEAMVPRDNSTLAFGTELLNYIIAFAVKGQEGNIKYLTVDLLVSFLQR